MTCGCACHDMAFYSSMVLTMPPCCFQCAQQAAPPKLTPADLTKINAQISIEESFAYTMKMVLTPPGGQATAYALNQLQYGCQIAISKQWVAENYMAAMEQAHLQLCKEMSAYFDSVGWPEWVLKVLSQPDSPEPMVQSSYTLPHWGNKFANAGSNQHLVSNGYVGGHTVTGDLEFLLPGLREVVTCPATAVYCKTCYGKPIPTYSAAVSDCGHPDKVRCTTKQSVQRMIVHLNDQHRWSREVQIADWLESLDVDLSFPSEEEIEKRKEERTQKVDSIVAQHVGYNPPSTIGKIMQDIYAGHIAFQQKQVDEFTASWHQKQPTDVHNHGNHVKFIDELMLEAHHHFQVPVHLAGEWVDKPVETVDPLEHKKNAAKHHQKFLHNPTKSKPPKKN